MGGVLSYTCWNNRLHWTPAKLLGISAISYFESSLPNRLDIFFAEAGARDAGASDTEAMPPKSTHMMRQKLEKANEKSLLWQTVRCTFCKQYFSWSNSSVANKYKITESVCAVCWNEHYFNIELRRSNIFPIDLQCSPMMLCTWNMYCTKNSFFCKPQPFCYMVHDLNVYVTIQSSGTINIY